MIGVVSSIDPIRRRAVVSAPYVEKTIRMLKRDLQTDTPFDERIIGQPISFDLGRDDRGRYCARNCWLCSCDFMTVAADNLAACEVAG